MSAIMFFFIVQYVIDDSIDESLEKSKIQIERKLKHNIEPTDSLLNMDNEIQITLLPDSSYRQARRIAAALKETADRYRQAY